MIIGNNTLRLIYKEEEEENKEDEEEEEEEEEHFIMTIDWKYYRYLFTNSHISINFVLFFIFRYFAVSDHHHIRCGSEDSGGVSGSHVGNRCTL